MFRRNRATKFRVEGILVSIIRTVARCRFPHGGSLDVDTDWPKHEPPAADASAHLVMPRKTSHPIDRNTDRRLLTRVMLRNYKSIAACDVSPAQLSFLVGPNGSGKSNFLDALRFVADSLRFSLDHALRDRGGINDVRRRSGGRPTHFGIRVEFNLANSRGYYAFAIGAKRRGEYEIQQEECRVEQWAHVVHRDGDNPHIDKEKNERIVGPILRRRRSIHSYKVKRGRVVESTLSPAPAAAADRLYLVNVSGVDSFRPVYDALAGTGFYNLNPEVIRDLQPPDPGDLLKRDGSNVASVLSSLAIRSPDFKQRVEEYLGVVVPGLVRVNRSRVGPKETLEFRQEVPGSQQSWRFPASNMSDGTLRAVGVLLALFQGAGKDESKRRLVGIEEPEAALHPAAAGALVDALRDAARHAQIFVTSHSPDLLDNGDIPDDSILAVVSEHGETKIGPLDQVGRSVLRDRMFTAGELLRMNQLDPDPDRSDLRPVDLELFGPEA